MKHRILMLTMIAILLLPISLLMLTPARVAHAATCTTQSGSSIVSVTINISANTGDTITVTTTGLASVSIMNTLIASSVQTIKGYKWSNLHLGCQLKLKPGQYLQRVSMFGYV